MWGGAGHGLLWPFVLSATLLTGIVAGIVCLRYDVLRERYRPDPAALAEASIAICSGALLWIGWWDFMDSYLVPESAWAKLCMLCVGALGAVWTRSLYADGPPRQSLRHPEGTSACIEDGADDPPPLARDGPPPLIEAMSPRPRSFGASEDDYDEITAVGTPNFTPAKAVLQDRRGYALGGIATRGGGRSSFWYRACCFLNPPRFSCSRCARALLATFSGLTMWVGLWDLLETHMLPAMFTSCAHEPSSGCAVVKLSLVAIGAFGLYLTRSLYGDHGVGAVQFQRL